MPIGGPQAVPKKVVRLSTFKRPAPAASFGCCRFQSNFVGFASVPGGYYRSEDQRMAGAGAEAGRGTGEMRQKEVVEAGAVGAGGGAS